MKKPFFSKGLMPCKQTKTHTCKPQPKSLQADLSAIKCNKPITFEILKILKSLYLNPKYFQIEKNFIIRYH
jgi:hypothetical protein